MEPRAGAEEAGLSRFGFRLVAGCALLVGLALIQDPGFLSSDTKFDLVAGPIDFLARALHLWDGEGAFGQVQNQAYGYLWPMGSFFALGWLVHLPGWLIQRLWLGLVMSVAFTGTAKLSRALGVRSDLACLVAGTAFALSPRMLSTLGPISIEAWPSALAPWVLLPLVIGSTSGSPRRAAALSALAVAMVGGVNAAATFAVLPLGAVWLLTRTSGPRRRRLMLWWPLFTALGTLWWLVPLFLLGAYSPPFLDFIETTSVTTFPTTVFDALRGTSDWVPYVDSGARAGNDLLRTSYLALNSAVVLFLGFAGLLDRRNPHRAFLALSVMVGMLMVTAGHTGAVEGWFADSTAALLDGSLAPLRNVHKFDVVIRLPLVIGLAYFVDRVVHSKISTDAGDTQVVLQHFNKAVYVGLAVVVVAGAAMPALLGRIVPSGATLGVPEYWTEAAAWLDAESDDTTALVVPGAPFGDYLWGEPKDEPLQYLGDSRWAVRNVIPLAPAGNIRMLDEIENQLAQGSGSPGFTAYLRRAGIEHLVVRNDLQRGDDVPDPVLVHQTIQESPGLTRVAEFGPLVGGEAEIGNDAERIVVNDGWQSVYPAVEIFEVGGRVRPAVSSSDPPTVVGGPEDLLDLADLGLISEDPTVLAVDQDTDPTGPVVLSDGLRARERFFARIHDGDSATITPGDRRHSGNPTRDYLLDQDDRWSTTARLDGATSISASGSASDAGAFGGSQRGALPYAAVDGHVETAWSSGVPEGSRAWWSIRLDEPLDLDTIQLVGPPDIARQVVAVETANGTSAPVQLSAGGSRQVRLPEGDPVDWIRVVDASTTGNSTIGLAEVRIPGVEVRRSLVLPTLPDDWGAPDAIALQADLDARTGCVQIGGVDRCAADRVYASEEPLGMSRVVTLPAAASYDVQVTARPRAGEALDELVLRDQPVSVSASSVGVPDPRASPVAMLDGDRGTSWIADVDDEAPEIALSWLGRERISSISLSLDDEVPARVPTEVLLILPKGGTRDVELGADGEGSFPTVRTDRLTIRVLDTDSAVSLGFDDHASQVPVGIGELSLDGLPYLPLGLPVDPVEYPCGTGPTIAVDGAGVVTRLRAAPIDLAHGNDVEVVPCGPADTVGLVEGENQVDLAATATSVPATMRLTVPGYDSPTTSTDATGPDPGSVTRTLIPTPGHDLVVMRENANPGWTADQDGQTIDPVVADGWQQGWWLDGDGPVEARYAPDLLYRIGLVVGLVGFVGLLVVVWLTRRRWAGPVPPALGAGRVPAVVLVGVALGGAGLIAGTAGLVLAIPVAVATLVLSRRAPEMLPWVAAAPILVAGFAYALRPWGGSDGWAGNIAWVAYVSLVPLVAALVAAVPERSGKTRFRRWEGRSTRR